MSAGLSAIEPVLVLDYSMRATETANQRWLIYNVLTTSTPTFLCQ